jgi:hypothetical protein
MTGLVSILISEAAGIGAGISMTGLGAGGAGISMTAAGLVSILISEAAGIGAGVSMTGLVSILISEAAGFGAGMSMTGLVSILISEAAGIGAGISMTAAGLVSILISEAAGIGAGAGVSMTADWLSLDLDLRGSRDRSRSRGLDDWLIDLDLRGSRDELSLDFDLGDRSRGLDDWLSLDLDLRGSRDRSSLGSCCQLLFSRCSSWNSCRNLSSSFCPFSLRLYCCRILIFLNYGSLDFNIYVITCRCSIRLFFRRFFNR